MIYIVTKVIEDGGNYPISTVGVFDQLGVQAHIDKVLGDEDWDDLDEDEDEEYADIDEAKLSFRQFVEACERGDPMHVPGMDRVWTISFGEPVDKWTFDVRAVEGVVRGY